MSKFDLRKIVHSGKEEYARYDEIVDYVYEELTNTIMHDIQACAHDYPELYIGLKLEPPCYYGEECEVDAQKQNSRTILLQYPMNCR
jgi:hypothetical protein